jgi:hypothetical protein
MAMSFDITPKVWGYERLLHNDKFCVKIMTLDRGAQCSVHFHAMKKEMFIVTKGAILIELWDKIETESVETCPGIIDLCKPDKMLVITEQEPQHLFEYYNNISWPYQHQIVKPAHEHLYIDNYVPHRFIGLDYVNVFIEASTHDDPNDSYRFNTSRKPDNIDRSLYANRD